MTDTEAREAAKLISQYCNYHTCDECVFQHDARCAFDDESCYPPEAWEV